MTVLHGLLDLLELLLTVLGAVLFHLKFLFFFDGSRPNLHIVDLLGLGEFEGLAVLLQDVGVEGHDRFVIELLHGCLQVRDPVFADGLDSANTKLSQYLIRTLLLLLFKSVDRAVDITHVVVLDLLGFKGGDAIGLLLGPQFLDLSHLRLVVLLQLDLRLLDVILVLPFLLSFLIELGLDLTENTVAFVLWSVHILHLLEHIAEFVAEIDQVLVDLSHLIESNDLLGMVSNGHDERKSVALVEKAFNLVPFAISIEVEHGLQLGKLDISEEVLALLHDSNGESLLDERSVLLQVRHDFDGLAQGFAALLRDLEWRLFELDEFKERGDVGVAHDIMNVLRVNRMCQACMRWDALDLEHLADLEDTLGHVLRVLELLAQLLGHVIGRKPLKVGQAVIESSGKGTEDQFTGKNSSLLVGDRLLSLHDGVLVHQSVRVEQVVSTLEEDV